MEGRSEPQSLTHDPLDPVDPVVNSRSCVLGIKNNEHENCHSKIFILYCFFDVSVIDVSCPLCFTMNLHDLEHSPGSRGASQSGVGCNSDPSTRAGGQDDVSSARASQS